MLGTLNNALLKRPVQARFASLIYAIWDERERLFRIANAGLPYPLCVSNGEVVPLKASGLPLDMFENAKYEEHTVACRPGDLVVSYTDGVTEAVNSRGEDFGPEQLQGVIRSYAGESAGRVVSAIFGAVASHTKSLHAFDDKTVVAVRT